MKYNRLSPRQGLGQLGLANFKQWSEGGSSRSRAPVPRYRGTVTVRLCSISHMVLRSISAAHSISIHFVPTVGWTYQVRPFCWGWNGLPLRYLQECLWLMTKLDLYAEMLPGTWNGMSTEPVTISPGISRSVVFKARTLLFVLFVFSCFGSGVCICFQNPNSKIQNLTSKVTDKNMKRWQNRLLDPVLFCAFHWISQVPKRPGKKW